MNMLEIAIDHINDLRYEDDFLYAEEQSFCTIQSNQELFDLTDEDTICIYGVDLWANGIPTIRCDSHIISRFLFQKNRDLYDEKHRELSQSTYSGAWINEGTVVRYNSQIWLVVKGSDYDPLVLMQPNKSNYTVTVEIIDCTYVDRFFSCFSWFHEDGYLITPKGYVINLKTLEIITCPIIRKGIAAEHSYFSYLSN